VKPSLTDPETVPFNAGNCRQHDRKEIYLPCKITSSMIPESSEVIPEKES